MTVTVLRDGAEQTITVTPDRRGDVGWLGVVLVDESKRLMPGPIEALGMSVQRTSRAPG